MRSAKTSQNNGRSQPLHEVRSLFMKSSSREHTSTLVGSLATFSSLYLLLLLALCAMPQTSFSHCWHTSPCASQRSQQLRLPQLIGKADARQVEHWYSLIFIILSNTHSQSLFQVQSPCPRTHASLLCACQTLFFVLAAVNRFKYTSFSLH